MCYVPAKYTFTLTQADCTSPDWEVTFYAKVHAPINWYYVASDFVNEQSPNYGTVTGTIWTQGQSYEQMPIGATFCVGYVFGKLTVNVYHMIGGYVNSKQTVQLDTANWHGYYQ